MNRAERDAWVDRYESAPQRLLAELENVTVEELDLRETLDSWCPREIVHHLVDAELTGTVRLRVLLAQDEPRIEAYDQDAFVRVLFPNRPIDRSLDAIAASRAVTVPILRRLSDEQWQRAGVHSLLGRYTVADWLRISVEHLDEHLAQLRRIRAAY